MSYNNCCDPCQGYYEPYQYYEPSVENWHFHVPKFVSDVVHKVESVLPSGEKLVDIVMHKLEPMLLPKLTELLKDKTHGLITENPENPLEFFVHEAPLLLKLKDFIETDIIKAHFGSFGNAASALFNEHWSAISGKITAELNPFINTHLATLVSSLGLPANAKISVVENYFDFTEDFGFDTIKDKIIDWAMDKLKVGELIESKIADVATLQKIEGYYATEYRLVVKASHLLNEARKWLESKGVDKWLDNIPIFSKKAKKFYADLWGENGTIAKKILPKVSEYLTKFSKPIIDKLKNLVLKFPAIAEKLGIKAGDDVKEVILSAKENFSLEGFTFLGGIEPYQYYEYEPYVYSNYCNC